MNLLGKVSNDQTAHDYFFSVIVWFFVLFLVCLMLFLFFCVMFCGGGRILRICILCIRHLYYSFPTVTLCVRTQVILFLSARSATRVPRGCHWRLMRASWFGLRLSQLISKPRPPQFVVLSLFLRLCLGALKAQRLPHIIVPSLRLMAPQAA